MTKLRVFIMGAGRAGRALDRAFRDCGVEVVGLHGHRPADDTTTGPLPRSAAEADVILVAVQDAQLEGALREVAGSSLREGAVILHASGSMEPVALAALRERQHPCGTFHPLVPLVSPEQGAEALRGAVIGVDGNKGAIDAGCSLAASLGARAVVIPRGAKARYHAAAVFASNFPVVVAAIAERIFIGAGLPNADARRATATLLATAASNVSGAVQSSGAASVLTGPVARGDSDPVASHLNAIGDDEAVRSAYIALTRASLPLARAGGVDSHALAAIARLLDEAESRST